MPKASCHSGSSDSGEAKLCPNKLVGESASLGGCARSWAPADACKGATVSHDSPLPNEGLKDEQSLGGKCNCYDEHRPWPKASNDLAFCGIAKEAGRCTSIIKMQDQLQANQPEGVGARSHARRSGHGDHAASLMLRLFADENLH